MTQQIQPRHRELAEKLFNLPNLLIYTPDERDPKVKEAYAQLLAESEASLKDREQKASELIDILEGWLEQAAIGARLKDLRKYWPILSAQAKAWRDSR